MNRPVSHRYEGTAMIARLSSLRVPAEPGPRYRAAGAAAARPRAHLARPPLPPQAAVGGPGRRCRPSTMYTDIACGPAPSICARGARNAAPRSLSAPCQVEHLDDRGEPLLIDQSPRGKEAPAAQEDHRRRNDEEEVRRARRALEQRDLQPSHR